MERGRSRRRYGKACVPMMLVALCSSGAGCTSGSGETEPVIKAQQVADMLHAVMEADRTAYTKEVVNRLVKDQKVQTVDPETKDATPLRASEQWKSEHGTLPLPAQMFRMGAEAVAKKNVGFTYALLSKWPVNKQNKAKTEMEMQGLDKVAANQGKAPFYGTEKLGDQGYFTAVYADVAVAPACIECHNGHKDSPRTDFKLGDVMGGVVIRVPLGDG